MRDAATFSFQYPRALEGVNIQELTISAQPTVLLGTNGAGKTTLMKLLARQLQPTRGEVPQLGKVVYVPQNFESIRGFRSIDYASYVAWLNGAGWFESKKDAQYWLQFVGLGDHEEKECSRLSGGQQARLQIATALNSRAEFILLDEPSAALDPLAKRDLQDLYGAIADSGVGLWVSSHQPLEVEEPFRKVVVLNRGTVDFQGSVQSFLDLADLSDESCGRSLYSEYTRALAAAFRRGR
ncbi:ATP-binding cassette domain-containing protein [Corynebacterium resistens]